MVMAHTRCTHRTFPLRFANVHTCVDPLQVRVIGCEAPRRRQGAQRCATATAARAAPPRGYGTRGGVDAAVLSPHVIIALLIVQPRGQPLPGHLPLQPYHLWMEGYTWGGASAALHVLQLLRIQWPRFSPA